MRAWPEPVERVTAFLGRAGAEVRVEEFPAGTPTAQDAADAIGCKLGEIVKSLVFECDGRAVDAEQARVATAARVRELTGFEPGAVAPFPPAKVDRVVIDQRLLLQEH